MNHSQFQTLMLRISKVAFFAVVYPLAIVAVILVGAIVLAMWAMDNLFLVEDPTCRCNRCEMIRALEEVIK